MRLCACPPPLLIPEQCSNSSSPHSHLTRCLPQGDGLLVTFLTFFHGTIDPFHLHLPGRRAGVGEVGTTKGFTEGMKVKVGGLGLGQNVRFWKGEGAAPAG